LEKARSKPVKALVNPVLVTSGTSLESQLLARLDPSHTAMPLINGAQMSPSMPIQPSPEEAFSAAGAHGVHGRGDGGGGDRHVGPPHHISLNEYK
jgi:hypothetical protein